MRNVINNEKGMSLISVTVAMGLMGIIMMTFVDMQVMTLKNQAAAKAEQEILFYVGNVRQNLADPVRATVALAGNTLGTAFTMKDPLIPTNVLAGLNFKEAQSNIWKVKSIQVTQVAVPSRADLYRLSFFFVFEKDPTKIMGPSIVRRQVGDVYCLAPANIITACFGSVDTQSLAQQTCVSMGATWNPTAGTCALPNVAALVTPPAILVADDDHEDPIARNGHDDSHGRHRGNSHYGHSHNLDNDNYNDRSPAGSGGCGGH